MSKNDKSQKKSLKNFLFGKEARDGYVPNAEAFAYAAGLGGQNITYNFVNGWLFYFCTNVLHISPKYVGILTGVSRVWDGINDPIVGAIVDRRNSRPGRKMRPYLLKFPFFVGIMTMLMFVDFGVPENLDIAIMLIVYLAWDTLYSFQDVGLWGTLALISPHSAERSRVTQWINIATSIAGGVTGLIPLILGAREMMGMSEKNMFLLFGIVFGFGGELISLSAAKTNERVIVPPKAQQVSFAQSFSIFFRNRNLLLLGAAQILCNLSITVPWIYFFKYCTSMQIGSMYLNGETVQFVFSALMAVPGAFSMFFAVKLAKMCGGMKNLLIVNQLCSITIRIIVFFIGYDENWKIILSAIVFSVTSIFGVAQNIALRSLIADSVDYMEWKTGLRTEGFASSFQNFIAKISTALQLFINGLVLDALEFDSKITDIAGQPEVFYKWQWPLFILGPAIGAVLYLFPAFFIKDNAAEKAEIEAELCRRRAAELETNENSK